MGFLSSMNIVTSGMTAQQLRLDVIAENITNSTTTRTESGEGPYRRKMVVFESNSNSETFQEIMSRTASGQAADEGNRNAGGVRVTGIIEDTTEFEMVYDPTHPDANEAGYVAMPNVDTIKEMTDAMAAVQAYSANVTAFNTLKSVISKGLEIGR